MRIIQQVGGLGATRPNEASAAQRIINVQARLEALYAERAAAEAIECGFGDHSCELNRFNTLSRLAPVIQTNEAELASALQAQRDLQAAQAAAPARMAATSNWFGQRAAQAEDARIQAELDAKLAAEKKLRDAAAAANALAEKQRAAAVMNRAQITSAQKRTLVAVEQKAGTAAVLDATANMSPAEINTYFTRRNSPPPAEQSGGAFTEQASGGLPTWAYVVGGLAVVGVAVWLGRK